MPWYRTGTVAITAGQTTVIGSGTDFSLNARVGDAFQGPDGRWYEVANIASTTVLSILPAYQGATVAGGAYGLAPMQGYVKESADRLRQITEQWGSTLASLGSVATENVVPVAKGGTGATNQADARFLLGLKGAAVAEIVGSVSNGAIIERGNNANGSYTKFADGTMICFTYEWLGSRVINSPTGALFYQGPIPPKMYPATFTAVYTAMQWGESDTVACWVVSSSVPSSSQWGGVYFLSDQARGASNLYISRIAIGRWA